MINHPARNYIYYLLSTRRYTLTELLEQLLFLEVPLPPDRRGIIELTRRIGKTAKEMVPPSDFNPTKALPNEATLKFLTDWGIRDAWGKSPYYTAAMECFKEHPIRRFIQICLIGPLRLEDIARYTKEHFDLRDDQMNLGIIRAFSHYFWNMGAVAREHLFTMVTRWMGNPTEYRQALSAPPTSGGVMLTLRAAGLPVDMPEVAVYQTIKDAMLLKTLIHITTPNAKLGDTQAAILALQGSVVAGDRAALAQGASSELMKHLESISTRYDTRPNATLKELPIDIQGEDITEHKDETQ
jgi:hypothetical protein